MRTITRKQLLNNIKNDPCFIADEKIFDSVKEKLGPLPERAKPTGGHRAFLRPAAGLAAW